jgi:uncharacterized protein YecT (DUF1311 family)
MNLREWGVLWLGLFLIAFCPGGVSAEEKNPCADPQTQREINACAAWQYEQTDDELNRVYRTVMSTLNAQQQGHLRAAQRVWTIFRDAHCKFAADDKRGSSMYPTVLYDCLISVTEARTLQLDNL